MAQEMPVPFQVDLEYETPARQPVPKEFHTQLDYFCQMVDYMKTSMSMRSTWPLGPDDQTVFDGFDFVSNIVFEEDLVHAYNERADSFGFGGLDLSAGAAGKK